MKIVGIYREEIFSPGKVKEDREILDKSLKELRGLGFETDSILPESIPERADADLILNMAQSDKLLSILSMWEKDGIRIINSPRSIKNCYRKNMVMILKENGISMPKTWVYTVEMLENELFEVYSLGWEGIYWVKRGDFHAIKKQDVVKVKSFEEMENALIYFKENKIDKIVIQEHVDGNVIKFYGVGKDYLRAFLEGSPFKLSKEMKEEIFKAADLLGVEVYGGDLILTPKEDFFIIDINDWPSFSICQEEASKEIARYVKSILEERK